MSPEAKRSFEAEWAVLARRLRLLLARKHVAPAQHDDLLQETALRLVSMWDSVDRRRELWPLTVTIALNLLRDRGRVVNRDDLVDELPEMQALTDVETAGIARMELTKVREAMDQLSESHRSILMKEIGGHIGSALPDGAGDKMLRMRARRKLRSALEKVSGLVALRVRRLGDLLEGMVVLRETGITAASCAFCLALGVGSAVVAPGLVPEASAGPVRGGADTSSSAIVGTARSATMTANQAFLRQAIARARAAGVGAPLAEHHDATDRPSPAGRTKAKKDAEADSENGLIRTLPVGGDGDSPSTAPIGLDPQNDAPPLPVGDGDQAPSLPPAPEPPAPPPPPPAPAPPPAGGDDSTDPLGGASGVVDQLL